ARLRAGGGPPSRRVDDVRRGRVRGGVGRRPVTREPRVIPWLAHGKVCGGPWEAVDGRFRCSRGGVVAMSAQALYATDPAGYATLIDPTGVQRGFLDATGLEPAVPGISWSFGTSTTSPTSNRPEPS